MGAPLHVRISISQVVLDFQTPTFLWIFNDVKVMRSRIYVIFGIFPVLDNNSIPNLSRYKPTIYWCFGDISITEALVQREELN